MGPQCHWTRASGVTPQLVPFCLVVVQVVRPDKRIAVLIDNCCACFVFCWLISVRFCVPFSFTLCVVYFAIKFIKYND